MLTSNRSLLLNIHKGMESLSLQYNEDVLLNCIPYFNVPFPRDPDFIERPAYQSWVRQQHVGPSGRIAFVGLGGLGYDLLFSLIKV